MKEAGQERRGAQPHRRATEYRSKEERLRQSLFAVLSAIVLLAPLPLGSARPLAWDVVGLCVALLLVASLRHPIGPFDMSLVVPAALFLAVAGFVVIQLAPWTPEAWHNPLWDQASQALGRRLPGAIAVYRHAALASLFRLLSFAGVFYLASILCREPARARAAVTVVAMTGSLYAAYGLIVYWSGNNSILWLLKWAYRDDLTGTFVNRNSFATFLGLCLIATLGHLALSLQDLHLFGSLRDKVVAVAEFTSARVGMIVCLFVIATALFLTHSRGGFISTLVGILAFGLAMSQAQALRRYRYIGWAAFPLMMVFIAFLVSGGQTMDRMADAGGDFEGRLAIYALTERAIGDYPLLGTGLGSFAAVFPAYRTPDISAYIDMAHNDYLQNLLELGIPAGLGLLAAILWAVGLCVRGVRTRRRDVFFPCLGIAASVLVGVHALVDFSLQIPAVTITYLFLLGTAVAQSRSLRTAREPRNIIADR